MIKRTVYISNPVRLRVKFNQLLVYSQETNDHPKSIPFEDLGFLVLEHPQITLSQQVMVAAAEHNIAVVFCGNNFMPTSLALHLETHTTQNERFKHQIDSSEPFKKGLWKTIIKSKITNQAQLLGKQGGNPQPLMAWAKKVKSGDSDNREARASRYYWSRLLGPDFKRERKGEAPNSALNYGYIVLRAATARALMGSGLLPTFGIFHKNRYNSFCLADDVMEPYRPFVDQIVLEMHQGQFDTSMLGKEEKARLLQLLTLDVCIDGKLRPLMNALTITSSSLARAFESGKLNLKLPEFSHG